MTTLHFFMSLLTRPIHKQFSLLVYFTYITVVNDQLLSCDK